MGKSRANPVVPPLEVVWWRHLPWDLEAQVGALIEPDNHARAHESPSHLTPADLYLGWSEAILLEGERINRQTLARRRLLHHAKAA
jgi:hypothetical protein